MATAQVDGIEISYEAVGDPTTPRGQCILYVHGTGCHGRVFERHMNAVAGAHTPVALDLPGHGRSGGSAFRGVADHAHYAVGLAAQLGWERFVIAGHSLGGGIALAAAIYHPKQISGMLLIDTGARLRVHPTILESARLEAEGKPPIPMDPRFAYAKSTPQSLIDEIETSIGERDPAVVYTDWIADDSCDFLSRLGAIETPTLAICGAEDRLTPPKYHEYLQQKMPSCRLEVIPDAGHWTYFEQPEAFDRAVLAFLDTLP